MHSDGRGLSAELEADLTQPKPKLEQRNKSWNQLTEAEISTLADQS